MTRSLLRALAALAAFALLGSLPACKQQDGAVRVHIEGPFRIPTDADTLVLDVEENHNTIKSTTFVLAAPTTFPLTVVLVESGSSHSTVKVNCTLGLNNRVVGRGTIDADFADGKTVDVTIDVLPQ